MNTPRKDWNRPPVVEVVLGVQFDTLPDLTNGHLGWFWGEMNDEFPKSDDVPPIPNVETLGEESAFGFPGFALRERSGDSRLRMTSSDGTKMIQIQNGWLVANWTKKPNSGYPGFTEVNKLFNQAMGLFSRFLDSRKLGIIRPNLWEVTYIDHIPRGTVWNDFRDLHKVFPGLFGTGHCPKGEREAVNASWGWRLTPHPGRLLVTVQSAKMSETGADILLVRSVARGPLGGENSPTLDACLNFGRSSVVDTFMEVTSIEAQRYWQGSEQ
jgi:uncharacterized protein (TIGR04255 family)